MLQGNDKESQFLMFLLQPNCENFEKRWLRKEFAIHKKNKNHKLESNVISRVIDAEKQKQVSFMQFYSEPTLHIYS